VPQAAQRCPRGEGTAHPVHPAAGRGRGRAEVDAGQRRRVRGEPGGGTGEELAQVLDAAVDVPAHAVGVTVLELCRAHRASREDPLAEAGAKRSICASILAVMSSREPFGTWQ
jgi:hypothetical protein